MRGSRLRNERPQLSYRSPSLGLNLPGEGCRLRTKLWVEVAEETLRKDVEGGKESHRI